MKLPREAFLPGRVYDRGWGSAPLRTMREPIENVARQIRREAECGMLRGVDLKGRAEYRRKCSARHIPSGCSVILTRDNVPMNPKDYHVSMCFVNKTGYEHWNDEIAEQWLVALFGEDRARLGTKVPEWKGMGFSPAAMAPIS